MKQIRLTREQIQQRWKDRSKQVYFNSVRNEWQVYFPRGCKPDCKDIGIDCDFLDCGCEILLPCSREAAQKEIIQQLRFIKRWEKINFAE